MEISRRHQDAGAEPGFDEVEKQALLRSGQRSDRGVAGGDEGGSRQRVLTVEHEVGGGDGELGDGDRVARVTEVDETGENRLVVGIHPRQQIVVVGVVVDNAALETLEMRDHVVAEVLHVALDQLTPRRLGDLLAPAREVVRAFEVPGVVAMGPRVVEAAQGQVESGERSADLFQELWRTFTDIDQRRTVQE